MLTFCGHGGEAADEHFTIEKMRNEEAFDILPLV